MRIRFDVTEWGSLMKTDGRGWRTWLNCERAWTSPCGKSLISEREVYSGRELRTWLQHAVERLGGRGTYVLKFKPTGSERLMVVGLAYAERGVKAHFVGRREEAYGLAVRAARMTFHQKGRDLTRLHPALVRMNEDVAAARARQEVEDEERRRIEFFAQELARQGVTVAQLEAMKPKMRRACEKAIADRAKDEASRKAEALLHSVLDEGQRESWQKSRTFRVTGSDGVEYRIADIGHWSVRSMTRPAFDYCLVTRDVVPRCDQLAMQKIMIEADAEGFKKAANRMRASNRQVEHVNNVMEFRELLEAAVAYVGIRPA